MKNIQINNTNTKQNKHIVRNLSYCKNKKALFDYEIIKEFEAGMILQSPEVKSIMKSKVSIKESYVKINNEFKVFLINSTIPISLEHVNIFDRHSYKENRERELLLNKKEIIYLKEKVEMEGLTIIPLEILKNTTNGKIKIKIALAKGKKLYDKKNAIKENDLKMEAKKELKNYNF
jgi:SsrA-binding protein